MGKKPDFEMPDDIPSWLMTFSDVITLLMTFFILLLTFATNQPETFERVQIAMFSGGGVSGISGPTQSPLELDSIVSRMRPRSGRLTRRGSEIPPINSDPATATIDKGLKGLEAEEERDLATLHSATVPIRLLIRGEELTSQAETHLRMLSAQIRRKIFALELLVAKSDDLLAAHQLAWALHKEHNVEISKISIGVSQHYVKEEPSITFVLNRPLDGELYGR